MNTTPFQAVQSLFLMLAFWPLVQAADQAAKKPAGNPAEAAIRASGEAFVKAFADGDAKAVAALWTENGTLVDDRGVVFKGRKAIEDEYTAFFKAYPKATMQLTIKGIEFPTPTTAIEDGTAQVVAQQSTPPVTSRYTAVHVQEGGRWLMASVRESAVPLPNDSSRLQDFAWLIGDWKAQREGTTLNTSLRWIANKAFIQSDYTVRMGNEVAASGMQIVGWDAQAGRVRSWSFDASGGHGTSLWSPAPDGWSIQSIGTLPDGTATTSSDFLIRVPGENNVFGWRSTERTAGQVALPDLPEVVLDRVPEKKP